MLPEAGHLSLTFARGANVMNVVDWVKLIGGGFSHQTAPFAVHPSDRRRAKEYVKLARAHGLTVSDAVGHAKEYLRSAVGWPTDETVQLQRVEKFVTGTLRADSDEIKGA